MEKLTKEQQERKEEALRKREDFEKRLWDDFCAYLEKNEEEDEF